ncbi:MAG: glycosyltransferase family 39 protein [Acidimicrobiales bacterium]
MNGNDSIDFGSGTDSDTAGGTASDLLASFATRVSEAIAPVLGKNAPEPRRLAASGRVDESPLPRLFLLFIGAITLGGLLLRLPSFNDSLAGDEISTYFIVTKHSLGEVLRLVDSNQETSPPLYFLIAWVENGVFGSTAQSIRLISLLTGTAAIPLTFLLGLWTVGRRAALVGAACVALAPFMIFYSTEARPYMLVLFFALLSTIFLLHALRTARWGPWAGYAVCTVGAAYSHYTVVFLLAPQLVWALWTNPKARPALIIANVAAGIAFLPWLGQVRADLHAPSFITASPLSFNTMESVLENFWIGHPVILITNVPGNRFVAVAGAGLAVGLVGLVLRKRGEALSRWRLPSPVVPVIVLAFVPALLIIVYSWTRTDLLGGRYLIASWPALALAIGALVTSPRRPLQVVSLGLTLVAFGAGAVMMFLPAAQRPNVNAAVAYIERVGAKGDPIVNIPYFHNPLSELDVALDQAGQSGNHPVIRLGVPALAQQLRPLSGPHPQPQYFGLPVASAPVVASEAASLAQHKTIFLFAPIELSTLLVEYFPANPVSQFVRALPSGYHLVAQRSFPGFSGSLLAWVYVFRYTGHAAGS